MMHPEHHELILQLQLEARQARAAAQAAVHASELIARHAAGMARAVIELNTALTGVTPFGVELG